MPTGINSSATGRISSATGQKCGDTASPGCCCGALTTCPTSCASCPSAFTLTTTGFQDSPFGGNLCCEVGHFLNVSGITLNQVGTTCLWQSDAIATPGFNHNGDPSDGVCPYRWTIYCACANDFGFISGVGSTGPGCWWILSSNMSSSGASFKMPLSACPATGSWTYVGAICTDAVAPGTPTAVTA